MKAIKFPQCNVTFAKDQPQYRQLPAYITGVETGEGRAVFCWKLSWWERLRLLFTGRLWHHVLTFNKPLQPQLLQVTNPFKSPKRNKQTSQPKQCQHQETCH